MTTETAILGFITALALSVALFCSPKPFCRPKPITPCAGKSKITRLGTFRVLAVFALVAILHAVLALFDPRKAFAASVGLCTGVADAYEDEVLRR